jgi:glyoxylase-like metal-dependent hydrolase (beta-lactamase superfamily II)
LEEAPNVYRLTVGEGEFAGVYAPNVYLVVGDDAAVFIDTTNGTEEEVRAHLGLWDGMDRPRIAAIVLTHRHLDHIGGAAHLSRDTGGELYSSPGERQSIEHALDDVRIGKTVNDGETLSLGGTTLEFIHTPGHTLGSLCVYHREQGILFTGDTILGTGSSAISPDHGDMRLYMESLRKLLAYDARAVYPGHGPVISDPPAKIRELIEHRTERERQILDLVRKGRDTVEELFDDIYPRLDSRLHDAARGQVRAHLVKLERDRKVVLPGDGSVEPTEPGSDPRL